MKKLSLFVSAFALCASSSYAAGIECGKLPTCPELGYADIVSQCPNQYIKCPFDTTMGKCIHEAAIGEIAYFPRHNPLGRGWLPCDGSSYPVAEYPELASFLRNACTNNTCSQKGNPFCVSLVQKYHGDCSDSTFAVPDYRGYFLRVAAMWRAGNSTDYNEHFLSFGGDIHPNGRAASIYTPQQEGLPNITGNFAAIDQNQNTYSNAIQLSTTWSTRIKGSGDGDTWGRYYTFNASKSNAIYGRPDAGIDTVSHVIPANYSVFAYIYAGKVVK